MILIGDIEATGLNVNSDKVHCGVFKDFNTKEVYEFRPNNLGKMAELLNKADKVVFHNGIQFDAPILRSNGIVDIPDEKIVDTLVLSRLYYPDRELGHSVEAWGKKLGYPKVEYDSWAEFDEDMLFRCKEDVEIQEKIYEKLLQERGDHDWSLAERIEHKIAKILFEQEQHGWKFRIDTAKSLVSWLEAEMELVESEIVPRLSRYYENKGELKKPFVQSGNLSANARKWLDGFGQDFDVYQLDDLIGGPFGRIEWHTVSLSQREKLCKKLMELGWKPSSYTDKGTPQLTPNKEPCPNLMKLGDIGEKLAYYFLASHRKSQIQGWIDNCREDNRVPAAVAGMTNTGRMRHAIVTNVPKAHPDMFLGAEMRGLFTCGEGYDLVGFDADALEIRLAAHYTGSQPFIEAITEGDKEKGTDPHSKVWKMGEQYGLVDRDMGKKCVPMDTQALTKEGWRYYNELSVGDVILTYNQEKNVKEWKPIQELHYFDDAEVIEVSHKKSFKVRATPDHRWFVRKRKWDSQNNKWFTKPYMTRKEETTDELNHESNVITNAPMTPDISGSPIDCRGPKYGRDWTRAICEASSSDRRSFLSGFLIADGYCNKDNVWGFSQINNEHYEAALTAAAIEHDGFLHVTSRTDHGGRPMRVVQMSTKQHTTMQRVVKKDAGRQPVWCVTTENGSWIMRQDDVITITGNSVYTGVYGASGKKFAQELGVSVDKGMKIREIVGDAFPGLLDLRSKVEKAARRGYLVGLDGRKVWMRRNERGEIAYHKAMNTLFQSAGGIIMKFVLCVLDQWCKKEGLDVKFVGNIHDEVQAEVAKKDVERYEQLCYAAFDKASRYFKLRCPVVCEVKVSDNWAETH